MSFEFQLRDYQHSSIERLRENTRNGIRNQVLCSPTGSGKTVMGAFLLNECHRRGKRGLFVCDRISLIDQTSAYFDRCGLPHGVIQGNHWRRRPGERIQVASAQTLARRRWPESDLTLIDEAHSLYLSVTNHIDARRCSTIGLTATPFTKGLGKHYDGIVTVTTTNKLIDEGYLSKYTIYAPSAPDMTGAKTVAGEWTDEETSKRAIPIIGDAVTEYANHGNGQKFIAFGCDLNHCAELQRQFMASGVNCQLYTYRTSDTERAAYIEEFRKDDSKIRGLISVSALAKGFDVMDVGCIIMCRPLKNSLAEHLQIMGRGLRPHACKEERGCIILDHSGNTVRFWDRMHDFYENSIDYLDDGKKKEAASSLPNPGEEARGLPEVRLCILRRTLLPFLWLHIP